MDGSGRKGEKIGERNHSSIERDYLNTYLRIPVLTYAFILFIDLHRPLHVNMLLPTQNHVLTHTHIHTI